MILLPPKIGLGNCPYYTCRCWKYQGKTDDAQGKAGGFHRRPTPDFAFVSRIVSLFAFFKTRKKPPRKEAARFFSYFVKRRSDRNNPPRG
jgi:hypothetical protein